MDKDDDEEGEKGANVTRYPVMPSLASLRLMRNRLHLANLGKKLMKWTAISAGRETRKIAGQLLAVYETFSADMIEAYIKLARSRYFYPTLNDRVTEHCPPQAKITVTKTMKSGAGMKLPIFNIHDSNIDGYEHLGIDKGGQCIKDTKEAWERLLKKIIMIQQLRTSFIQVDAGHKTATKKVNVLQRVQIPRICMTVKYILTELDEQEREEMFRLKRFKEKKSKKKAEENKAKVKLIETINEVESEVKLNKSKEITIEPDERIPEVKSKQMTIIVPVAKAIKEPEINELGKRKSDLCIFNQPQNALDSGKHEQEDKLELLKKHLQEVIVLSRKFLEEGGGFKNGSGEKFISTCNETQQQIDQLIKDRQQKLDENLRNRLEHIKRHLREMIVVTSEFYDEPSFPPCDLEYSSDNVDKEKDPCCLEETTPRTSISEENHTEELKNHIEEIEKLIKDYKKEGLISESVDALLTSCDHVKSKINIYAKEIDDARNQKLDFLQKQVTFVEESAKYINQEGMEDFLCSCKSFKGKLDEYKQTGQKPPPEGELAKLVSQIDKTIELSQEAKKEGFKSENLDYFIKSCDDMKTHIESKYNTETKRQPKCLKQLKSNINDIMMLVSKCRAEGSLTKSAEAFIQSCEKAKAKIDVLGKNTEPNKQVSIGSCLCEPPNTASHKISCGKCASEVKKESATVHLTPPACNYCNNSFSDMLTEKVMRDTCLLDPFDEVDWLSYVSAKPSEENTCLLCKGSNKEDTCKGHQDHVPEGYFRVVTKIKRTHHLDGSVREVRETITTKNEKNKHIAALLADDHDGHGTDCVHDSLFNGDKKVHTCITPNQNQSGFSRCIKKVTSEKLKGNAPMAEPCSKQCISMSNFVPSNKNQQSTDNLSVNASDLIIDLMETNNKPSSSKKND